MSTQPDLLGWKQPQFERFVPSEELTAPFYTQHHWPGLLPSPGERRLWKAPDCTASSRAALTEGSGTESWEQGPALLLPTSHLSPSWGFLLDLASGCVWEGTCQLQVNICPKICIHIQGDPKTKIKWIFFFFFGQYRKNSITKATHPQCNIYQTSSFTQGSQNTLQTVWHFRERCWVKTTFHFVNFYFDKESTSPRTSF